MSVATMNERNRNLTVVVTNSYQKTLQLYWIHGLLTLLDQTVDFKIILCVGRYLPWFPVHYGPDLALTTSSYGPST